MKPIYIILGLILAAGAGALGGSLVATRAPAHTTEALQPQVAALQPAVAITPEVSKRLEALSMEISALETQLAAVRDERARTPVVAAASAPDRASVLAESTESFAAVHRDAILKVVADERAEQERKREEERKQREEQQLANKADRAAQKFNLNDAQKRQLTEYYVTERQKFDEMRMQFREGTAPGGPNETARDAFKEARDWRTNELTRLFGTDLGAQINEFETDRGRGGVAGGGGGARRQGANANGNGAVRGDSVPQAPVGQRPGGGF